MKRLRQIIFNSLSVASLLLCVATIALWIRSYAVDDHLGTHRVRLFSNGQIADYRAGLISSRGSVALVDGTRIDSPGRRRANAPNTSAQGEGGFGHFTGSFSWWYAARDENYIYGFCANGGPVPDRGAWDKAHWGFRAVPHAFFAAFFLVLPLTQWLGGGTQRVNAQPLLIAYGGFLCFGCLASIEYLWGCFFVPLLGTAAIGIVGQFVSRRAEKRARRRAGLCPVCSYDLRASPDRCPECGTVTAKPS